MPTRRLRVLIVEDSEHDAELLLEQLRRDGLEVESDRVQTAEDMRDALSRTSWDVVVSDYSMPAFSAPAARVLLTEMGLDIPFIIVSGTVGEEAAVTALKAGAHDVMAKQRLTRLVPAIERAMRDAEERRKLRATERALSETRERMRFALEAAGVGTWEWDIVSGTLAWSDLLERLHGLPAGGFAGTLSAFIELVHPDDRSRVRDQITRFRPDQIETRFEYRRRWADGSTHWITALGRIFHDDGGRPVRAAGIGMDITAQKDLELQLLQSQKMEAIGQLAGGIAHDFNNLLTAMVGHTELLLPSLAPETRQRAHVEQIARSCDRAKNLTRQLLAFSRRQVLQPKVIDLNALVTDLSQMLRRLIGEDVELVLALDPALPPMLADPGQIEQVVMNLAVNARDAMPRGGRLTIETGVADVDQRFFRALGIRDHVEPTRLIRLAVIDTGVGMDEAVRRRVFEPFFTTKPRGKGTGLGLATVYGIVKQTGGFVTVDTALETGSAFRVFLPPAAEDVSCAAEPLLPARPSTGHERVLVVEDDEEVRPVIRAMLERHGYCVVEVADAEAAIDIAGREPFELLVTDVVLPGRSGPELFECLRIRNPRLKALYLSGYSDDLIERRGLQSPGVPYLQKPFTAAELGCKVRDVLDAVHI